jgi:hydroxyacylglutathione hydrolase
VPDWLDFRPRLLPSCNFAWLRGPRPVLVDSGFGSDLEATQDLLPGEPALVFNTHWHSDHVGNAGLAVRFGRMIAASAEEGSRVNAGDPEAFGADWFDQPVDPYRLDRLLEPRELIETGAVSLRVVPAAGHSPGQVALFEERSRVLLAGDAILAHDVAFINPFLDGAEALETANCSLERIGRLDARLVVAGHGDVIEDVGGCVKRSLDRLRLWRQDPARMAIHACRRVFGFALMIHGGFACAELRPYLLARRWVHDFAPLAGLSPDEFAEPMVADLASSGAARWERERLVSAVPHTPVRR